MPTIFVNNNIYYKIFDKSYQQSSHIYSKYRYKDAAKIAEVEKNKKLVLAKFFKFFASHLLVLKQIHGNIIIDADKVEDFDLECEGDGVVTTKTGIVLAIQTADCVPVLLSDIKGKVIGAAHCGWRSSKSDIINNLVKTMREKGAGRIKALIGPSIQQNSYEVDGDYYASFIQDRKDYQQFFISSTKLTYYMFDLPAFVALKLKEAGIDDISRIEEDTYSMPTKYPSYRRDCHLGEIYAQNILSTIMIREC